MCNHFGADSIGWAVEVYVCVRGRPSGQEGLSAEKGEG